MDSVAVSKSVPEWREALVRYYPRVRGWYARTLSDPTAVEELSQEVFLRLYEQLAEGETLVNAWNYIKVIARNVFLEHLRAQRRRQALRPLDESAEAAKPMDPADTLGREEARRTVPQLLDQLPEAQRALLVGRYYLGLTVRELAKAIGTSASTVVERHNRALCRLRDMALSRGIDL